MVISSAPISAPTIVSETLKAVRPCEKCGSTEQCKDGRCSPCDREKKRAWYAANKDKASASSKAWRTANPEIVKALKRAYRAANPEKVNATAKAWRDANPGSGKERKKAYRATNRDKINVVNKVWRDANPEKLRPACVAYRTANKDKLKVASAVWVKANAERIKVTKAAWRKDNPDACRISAQNRRAKKLENGGRLSKGLTAKLFKLQQGKCPCCAQPLGNDHHMDHKMPLALGGSNTDDNMQLLRAFCNLSKSAKDPLLFMQSRGFLL